MKQYIVVVAVCTVLLYGCGQSEKPVDITEAKKTETEKIETGNVSERPLSSYVRLPGQLKAFNEVNIFAKINSFIKQIYADRGTQVKRGQLLAELEAPEMMSQVQSANARFVQAQEAARASREKYRRLKEAAKEEGAVSPLDLDNAMSKMKADEAVVLSEQSNAAAVRDIQSYLKIRAPFDGVIVQRNVSAGALVGPGKSGDQPMLVLQDTRKLRLEVMIPEAYVDKVDLKQQVSASFTALPGFEKKAAISRSANALGNQRSEAIEVDIINTGDRLKPGMYGEVKIPLLLGAKSLTVPNNAIVRSTERQYVIKIKEGKTVFADVKEGVVTNDYTEVFGNLKPGDRIVLRATDELKEGQDIK